MAFANYDTKEIHCKVMYFGVSGAGKTSNLRKLLEQTDHRLQSGNFELNSYEHADKYNNCQFFEFMPVNIGKINNHNFIAHLYTFPKGALFDSFYSVILKGIDGLVFVVDSAIEKLPMNINHWDKVQGILHNQGMLLSEIPCVVQYNKRDLSDAVPTHILRQYVNKFSFPDVEANALTGEGVIDSLSLVIEQFMQKLSSY